MRRQDEALVVALQLQVIALIDADERSASAVCREADVSLQTVWKWRTTKRGASVGNLSAVLDVLGYELVIQPKAR